MSSWSIALCGWFERSWQSTASLSVKSYLVATFLLFSCVGLYWGGRVVIDYLLTFIECVKYTSFALTSYLVSKLHSFIQTMPWSTRGIWSLWPCTLCTIVYILPQSYQRFQLQLFLFADGKKKVQIECEKEWGAKKMGILPCAYTTQCGFGLSSLYPKRFFLFSDNDTYGDLQGCSCWFT